jgi:hypothetical protein
VSRPFRVCGFCDKAAVWRWVPKDPPRTFNVFLCDDHAAETDLSELEELGDVS